MLRRPNPTGLRSGMGWLRCVGVGDGRECRGGFGIGQGPEPLDPGEDPSLPVIESLLDVGREDEPAAGSPNAERDRDGVFGFVGDGDRDPLHAELVCACGRTPMKADGRLTGREALDLDVAPADAADAEAEHLRDGLLGRPPAGHRLGTIADIPALRFCEHTAREPLSEALERCPDPLDLDDVDAELRRAGRYQPRGAGGRTSVIGLPYSTVTDLARLRGWSTSVPRASAT